MTNHQNFKRFSFIAILVVLAFALIIPATMAQDTPPVTTDSTITVTGIGEASAAPDMATVVIGVELVGQDISTVYSEVNTGVANVKAALEALGIAPSDITTAGFDIYVNPIYMGEGQPTQNETRVANRLNVTVRDLTLIESVIDTAVGAGANGVYGLTFDISDKASLEAEARTNALADARDRAGQLAAGIGVELGVEVRVVEYGTGYGYPMPMSDRAMGGGGGAVIEPGQFTTTFSVEVTYTFNR